MTNTTLDKAIAAVFKFKDRISLFTQKLSLTQYADECIYDYRLKFTSRLQNYTFSFIPPRKSPKICKNYCINIHAGSTQGMRVSHPLWVVGIVFVVGLLSLSSTIINQSSVMMCKKRFIACVYSFDKANQVSVPWLSRLNTSRLISASCILMPFRVTDKLP